MNRILKILPTCLPFLFLLSSCGSDSPDTPPTNPPVEETFSFTLNSPLPSITSVNATAYPLSGSCVPADGDVLITIDTPVVTATFSCPSTGTFSGVLDVSSVTLDPPNITASQSGNSIVASPLPLNDQDGPASAPVATGPGSIISGASYGLVISCNEVGEAVSITGTGISPSPQSHTCTSTGSEFFVLSLQTGISLASPNNLTLSSEDPAGNPASSTTQVDLPIDTLAPTIVITNGGNTFENVSASFTLTVTDDNISSFSYTPTVSSGVMTPSSCTSNPCNVSISGASVGSLTLTVVANSISDDLSNTAPVSNSTSSLTVSANPAPTVSVVSIVSTDGDSDSWYEDSDTVTISVQFSESVTVNTAGGTPNIPVTITSGVKSATYVSGSGTDTLNFNFSVSDGDEQCNGTLALSSLVLNGGTIKSSVGGIDTNNSGTPATLSGVQIDALAPILSTPDVSAGDAASSSEESVTTTWTATESCGISSTKLAIGTYSGGTCTVEATASFQTIGAVTSYQAISGTAPFDGANIFDLIFATDYCSTVQIVDSAGNEYELSSGKWEHTYAVPSSAMWFDASDSSTIFTDVGCSTVALPGEEIACWSDKSASSNDLIHNGVNTKPLWGGGGVMINSRNVLEFDSSDALYGSDIFSGSLAEVDVFLVLKSIGNSTNFLFNFNGEEHGATRYSVHYYYNTLTTSYWDAGGTSNRVQGDLGVTKTDSNVINFRNSVLSTDTSVWTNGVEALSKPAGGQSGPTTGGFALSSITNAYHGQIAELVIFNSFLSSSDRELVEGYLACKWGTQSLLPVAHPYKTCP